LISKFISGAVLAGAVTAGIAGVGAPAMAATPSTTHAVTHAAAPSQEKVYRGPYGHRHFRYPGGPFAGRYYYGSGPYFNWGVPGFEDWWGVNDWRFAYGPTGYVLVPGASYGLVWNGFGGF
jgi:hypothetical protein